MENHDSHECMVQVELETGKASTKNAKDGTQNAGSASTKYQQPYNISTGRDKRSIKLPTRYGFEDFVSYALITSSGDPTNFQEAVHS